MFDLIVQTLSFIFNQILGQTLKKPFMYYIYNYFKSLNFQPTFFFDKTTILAQNFQSNAANQRMDKLFVCILLHKHQRKLVKNISS